MFHEQGFCRCPAGDLERLKIENDLNLNVKNWYACRAVAGARTVAVQANFVAGGRVLEDSMSSTCRPSVTRSWR